LELNKIIGSTTRRKILEVLSENRELSIMKLVRLVNSTHNEVDRNLGILEKEKLVVQQLLGRNRIIHLNYENKKTLLLLETLIALNNCSSLFRKPAPRNIYGYFRNLDHERADL
jgi:DNA-binding transcriptional ArsR family regulator